MSLTLPDDLRAITLRQPYAQLVAVGAKTIETRGRRCNYRGPIAVHAAAKWTFDQFVDVVRSGTGPAIADALAAAGHAEPHTEPRQKGPYPGGVYYFSTELVHDLPLGAIVAVANLVDCVPIVRDSEHAPVPFAVENVDGDVFVLDGDVHEHAYRSQGPYGDFTPGRYALLLEDVTRLPEPVPAKGNQAVPWRVPADVAAKVREQVEGLAA